MSEDRVHVTVHVLHHGRSLCPIDEVSVDVDGVALPVYRTPQHWPPWNIWVRVEEVEATARACADADHVIHHPIPFRMCETCVANAATAPVKP